MKRIQEKVKDLIEVHKLPGLQDFYGDPEKTLGSYRFTDATAELMVKWLARVVGLQTGQDGACALAGYRGVGKSHFMGAFGALVAMPELRTKVTDSYVANGAQGLLRRRYPVVYVRRGTHETLQDEVKEGISHAFEVDPASLPDDHAGLLSVAKTKAGDLPFLLLIDTAMERGSRVARDDGSALADLAESAKAMNAFIAVALDDDISGADGTNAAIVKSFTIDYLDQEHLYKVVDTFVFPKSNQNRAVLHDIYEYFRSVMPSFRWSEQKFSSLYPLHPVILEVAPFVRLFVHDFALLGFASEAGERILGRPANSLIALDEVFDRAEKGLRKIDDLQEAFAAYDRLNADVVAKIPVMQRLQAKLILKALLLLSLDGQGTTAPEITAGMLIFDEKDPQKASRTVEELIRTFAAALPDDVRVYAEEGREIRYSLKVSSKDLLNSALDETASRLDKDVVNTVLHRLLHESFSDSTFFAVDGSRKDSMECHLMWRGGLRRGRVTWLSGDPANTAASPADELHDWEVVIDAAGGEKESEPVSGDIPRVVWRPAELRTDEIEVLRRLYVLNSDHTLREQFGDQIRASLHSHIVHAQRIANRIFIEDGRLVIDSFDYNFTEEARGANNLSDLFTSMLEPLFEARYPQHPYFLRRLGISEVSSLVTDLYSGSRHLLNEVQQLAQTFALPLGIVRLADGAYVPESAEKLSLLPAVASIQKLVETSDANGVAVRTVYSELKKPPYGFVREAQQLIMAAMVSQRMIEFVTSKGDRINQRSLDLKIIWDDIVGLARPSETSISSKKLVPWAELFSGGREFKSFDDPAHCGNLVEGITEWLEQWDKARTLERFNEIPPEAINTRVWRTASRTTSSLGAAVKALRRAKENGSTLEECFGRIAEIYLDDPAGLSVSNDELKDVESFVRGFWETGTIGAYVALAEQTDDEDIENEREKLMALIEDFGSSPVEELLREIGYGWARFQRGFIEYFAAEHDAVMLSHQLQAHADEIRRGDDWWEFENLADTGDWAASETGRVRALLAKTADLNCSANTKELLKERPFCTCGFSLSHRKEWSAMTADLETSLSYALASMKAAIVQRSAEIAPMIEEFAAMAAEKESAEAIRGLAGSIRSGAFPGRLTSLQIGVLRAVLLSDELSRHDDIDDAFDADLGAAWGKAEGRGGVPLRAEDNAAVVS